MAYAALVLVGVDRPIIRRALAWPDHLSNCADRGKHRFRRWRTIVKRCNCSKATWTRLLKLVRSASVGRGARWPRGPDVGGVEVDVGGAKLATENRRLRS